MIERRGTTRRFREKIAKAPTPTPNMKWPAGPSPESPRKGRSEKKFPGIEVVDPKEFGEGSDSESLLEDFSKDLRKVLSSMTVEKPFTLAVMQVLINTAALKMNMNIKCELISNRLYFSYRYGKPKMGFYYITQEMLESILPNS